MRYRYLPLVLLLFVITAAAQIKLDQVGGLSDAKVPETVRSALEPNGYRVVRSDETALAEIWLRKSVPPAAQAGKDRLYPELSPSVMVGVVCFPSGAKDFRGQPIKPGCYTMRYELLPQDGNHLGVAPHRDFLLLVPCAADPDPAANFDFAKLVSLSAKTSGTNHPATFSMLPPESGPKASQNADGFIVFAGALKLDSGKALPFSLVLKGQAEQ